MNRRLVLLAAGTLAFFGASWRALEPSVQAQAPVLEAENPEPVVLLRGPFLQNLTPQSVEIVWVTSEPAAAPDAAGTVRVEGGLDGPQSFVADPDVTCMPLRAEDDNARCHRVFVDRLTPDAPHTYRIFVGETEIVASFNGETNLPFRFATPPDHDEGQLVLAALGDSGSGTEAQLLVAEVINDLAPIGILHTGDVDYLGDPDRSVFEPYRELLTGTCLFPARGNHDTSYPFPSYFFVPGETADTDRTFFSFDWGPVHVIVCDTTMRFEPGEPGEEQVDFIRDDLAAARAADRPWIIAVLHTPIFTTGPHVIDAKMMEHRNLFAPIFDDFDVDLVLSGDDHLYSRSSPLRILDERCPELDNLRCVESEIPFCYEIVDAEQRPHYASPGGTIYVVTGGGGQIPYIEYEPRGDNAECHFVDTAFREVSISQLHAVELEISGAMIRARAWDLVGRLIDEFSIQKIRAVRGDVDQSGGIDLGDAVSILGSLFLGQELVCPQAGNADGGESLDIADAVYLLNFLFLGGAAPVAPFPECGPLPEALPGFCSRSGC